MVINTLNIKRLSYISNLIPILNRKIISWNQGGGVIKGIVKKFWWFILLKWCDLLPICCYIQTKKSATSCTTISYGFFKYSERDLNPHGHNGHWILSPTCLPIPPSEQDLNKRERKTGFEPATLTLARWCSTPELLSQVDSKCNYFW